MKPRLEARESLRRRTEISLGTASMKKESARDVMREWLRQAKLGRRARSATSADLAKLPIKVTHVSKET